LELNIDVARPAPLSDAEITTALERLPEWEREGNEIVRTFECAGFPDAIAFVVRIAFFAEKANHHPDLDIRWRKVRVALTTHDAGGLTDLDVDLARQITDVFPATSTHG
jgi:4a-hydroxytetrahydrobiopterin dehydratase